MIHEILFKILKSRLVLDEGALEFDIIDYFYKHHFQRMYSMVLFDHILSLRLFSDEKIIDNKMNIRNYYK